MPIDQININYVMAKKQFVVLDFHATELRAFCCIKVND